jgi:hypothetical protein
MVHDEFAEWNEIMTSKKQNVILSILIVPLLLILAQGCKKDDPPCTTCPPPPPTTCSYSPGNRNFTWRLDTVAWFPSTVGGVWAFSDTDAYMMGYIVDGRPPYTLRVGRHWNGRIWEDNINGTWGVHGDITISPDNDLTGDDHLMVAAGWYGISTTEYAGVAEFDNRTKRWTSHRFSTVGQLRSIWTDGNGFFVAAGDNGMIYTKDGYSAGWAYSQAPTGFNIVKIHGNSKSEFYALGDSAIPGTHYQQIWRFAEGMWIKLLDNQDTSGTPIQIPEAVHEVTDIAVSRCSITDSLHLYVTGRASFEFTSSGTSLAFERTPLFLPGANYLWGRIFLFSPNDHWITRSEYHMYHWNGTNLQKMEPVPWLPYGQLWGTTITLKRGQSEKTWLVLEMDSQVYAVLQGLP